MDDKKTNNHSFNRDTAAQLWTQAWCLQTGPDFDNILKCWP